jgi:alpha-tubulin suppressor-like RCC1 family protein
VAYVTRCARQRYCREAPPIAAGHELSLYIDADGLLLSCGMVAAVGHGNEIVQYPRPTSVSAMAGIQLRSVATGICHSLALGWDDRIYLWGA